MRHFLMSAIMASLALFAAAPMASAGYDDFVGAWSTTSPGDGGLVALDIRRSGGNVVTVQIGAQCSPRPCDWGRVNAVAYAPNAGGNLRREANTLVAVYNQGFATKTVVIGLATGGKLTVSVFTQFSAGDGRTNYIQTSTFQRGGGGGDGECIAVRPRWGDLNIRNVGGLFVLRQGGQVLGEFDSPDEAGYARLLIVSYRLKQLCTIGDGDNVFEYWLTDAGAPEGMMPGEDCLSFNPGALRARRSGGMWLVQDGRQSLYALDTRADADAVIAVIRELGFEESCFVGRPDPGMSYLRR